MPRGNRWSETLTEWVIMLRRMPIVVGLSLALISPAHADFEMTFEAQAVEEDADSKAELREAISAYKRDDFLRFMNLK